jgi:hypothetical protein
MWKLLAALALALVTGSCERVYRKQACRMESETILARTRKAPSAVGLARLSGNRYLAAWSVDNASWIALVDRNGSLLETPRRLAAAINTTDTASTGPKTFWPIDERQSIAAEHITVTPLGRDRGAVAFLERSSNDRRGGAFAAIVGAEPGHKWQLIWLGPAGEFASRIAAIQIGGRLVLAWHDGHPDASNIQLVALNVKTGKPVAAGQLATNRAVYSPTLAATRAGDTGLIAWSETTHTQDEPQSMVQVASISPSLEMGPRTKVAQCRFMDPAPILTELQGQFGIVFRDDADNDEWPEFYFAALEGQGKLKNKPTRISKADGFQGPSVIYAGNYLVSAAIRSFQHNMLIGVNRFTPDGTKLGGEFQIYADRSDFVRVALAGDQAGILLVYGEDRHESGRVIAGKICCAATP